MGKSKYTRKKNFYKKTRTVLQLLLILLLILALYFLFFDLKKYQQQTTEEKGNSFIAVSYFGVEQAGSDTLVEAELLDKHLKALKDSGYVTITQSDIIDFYNNNKPLPKKALFLMFEDGRRDTALFAHRVLEKHNYKATILTYANKFEKKDNKFLNARDLMDLDESSYWEIGTNGYRLSYINVFDRYENYVGELNAYEFVLLSQYFDRDYDHYLMDFIRDANGVPKENYGEMYDRIVTDYDEMSNIYSKEVDVMPRLYILMHSNSGQFGTNDKVSDVNSGQILRYFDMNFNREGDSLNDINTNIYDLTRVQPQAYWPVNHLLMKVLADTKMPVEFVAGSSKESGKWHRVSGAVEYLDESIIITSEPKGYGRLILYPNLSNNYEFNSEINGNIYGSQSVYVLEDESMDNAIQIELNRTTANLYWTVNGNKTKVATVDLNVFDEIEFASKEEDEQASLALTNEIKEMPIHVPEEVRSVEEGAESYIPTIQFKHQSKRTIKLVCENEDLDVYLDEKILFENINLEDSHYSRIMLEASSNDVGYSQRNLTDSIYDAIFNKLVIIDTTEQTDIVNHNFSGFELYSGYVVNAWEKTTKWFIDTL